MSTGLPKNFLTIFLCGIVVIMGIEILFLINQNRELKGLLAKPAGLAPLLTPKDYAIGFDAVLADGTTVAINYSDASPTRLLLWFSPSCDACDANFGLWNDIYANYDSPALQVMGVCRDDPEVVKHIIQEFAIEFPVACLDDDAIVDAYHGTILPQTMLIASDGAVQAVWPGQINNQRSESILEALQTIAP